MVGSKLSHWCDPGTRLVRSEPGDTKRNKKLLGTCYDNYPLALTKKEPILKTSLILLNFIDPGLFQFIAKEMFTRFAVIYRQRDVYLQNRLDHSFFKLSWYSNLFAYFNTWKEKQWTPVHAKQEHIHIGKNRTNFSSQTNLFKCVNFNPIPLPSSFVFPPDWLLFHK